MNCKACNHTLCCKKYRVDLTVEEINSQSYKMTIEDSKIALPKDNNACIYLEQDQCSIYSNRPMVCVEYNCDNDSHMKILEKLRKISDYFYKNSDCLINFYDLYQKDNL